MNIGYKDRKLIITDFESKFKPKHKSQLIHWGFNFTPDNEFLLLDRKVDKYLLKILKYFDKSKINYVLSTECENLISEIRKQEENFLNTINIAGEFKNGKFDKRDFTDHITFLNKYVHRKLKSHQIKASYHLYLLKNGANFSVPGSGKTTVVLSVFERLRLDGLANVLFVVGPPACFGPWKEEFQSTLGRIPNSIILAGGNISERNLEYHRLSNFYELYLMTFQTLFNDIEGVETFFNNKKIKIFLVIDEAHYIKQLDGNWSNAVLQISKYADFKCVLTGTPMPKSYSDIFNLFDVLWIDYYPIQPENKAKLLMYEEKKEYKLAKKILDPCIGPLFYRVRKSELGLKEQIFNSPVLIKMNVYERKIYEAILKKIRTYSKEDYLLNIELIVKLRRGRMIRLRQCLTYTKLLSSAINDYDEDLIKNEKDLKYIIFNYDKLEKPLKLNHLVDMIKLMQNKNEKVVVWSNFIGTIELIERELSGHGFYCKKIIGKTPIERTSLKDEETRERIRNEFVERDSGLDILIANPAACSESISLHKTCSNAIYYDLSYNCAQYLQSLDRIHRVGGSEEKPAFYHYLQYEDTIEHEILHNINSKAQKMYHIIEDDYNIYSMDMFDDSDELEAYEKIFRS
jgi:SNF2 family DNA or RNA helicase